MMILTDTAIEKVQDIIGDGLEEEREEEAEAPHYLRVAIKGGGCSGFSYEFDLPPAKEEGDKEIRVALSSGRSARFTLLVDPFSLLYLKGAMVDFLEDEMGEKFVVRNPNAKTTCGCGESFDA